MQRVAETISGFLKVFGGNGDRKVCWHCFSFALSKSITTQKA
ncbi:hypothetical protein [Sanguibacteroides justesenii]|nr:hypothetical protein [Sanguibacteroides justesenii]